MSDICECTTCSNCASQRDETAKLEVWLRSTARVVAKSGSALSHKVFTGMLIDALIRAKRGNHE